MFTLWRTLLYKKIEDLSLQGKVIDLGGSKNAPYHKTVKGNPVIIAANIDQKNGYDLFLDLEKPFPIESESFEGVMSFNVLEHIYHYESVLQESHRILKKEGKLILAVPFLISVHPCPHDYWRYTEETLRKLLSEKGFREIEIESLGRGAFTASAHILHNILKWSFFRFVSIQIAAFLDKCVMKLSGKDIHGKKFYPLGYFVTAKK